MDNSCKDESKERTEPMPVPAPAPAQPPACVARRIPPIETRFKPGVSGNPRGRPSAGMSIVEEKNRLVHLSESELKGIRKNRRESTARRAAANVLLYMAEHPDMADFEPLLDRTMTLKQLRASGVDTSLIKRVKTDRWGNVSIELHDRAIRALAAVLEATGGKTPPAKSNAPVQVLIVNNPVGGRMRPREQHAIEVHEHDHGHEAEAGPASDGNGQAEIHNGNGHASTNGNGQAHAQGEAPSPPAAIQEPDINLEGPT